MSLKSSWHTKCLIRPLNVLRIKSIMSILKLKESDTSMFGKGAYWHGPNYWKEFTVFQLFVTKTKKKTVKNTRRSKVNSSSIRQYTFCLEI